MEEPPVNVNTARHALGHVCEPIVKQPFGLPDPPVQEA